MINFNETVIKIVLVVLNEKNAHSNYESFCSFLFISYIMIYVLI